MLNDPTYWVSLPTLHSPILPKYPKGEGGGDQVPGLLPSLRSGTTWPVAFTKEYHSKKSGCAMRKHDTDYTWTPDRIKNSNFTQAFHGSMNLPVSSSLKSIQQLHRTPIGLSTWFNTDTREKNIHKSQDVAQSLSMTWCTRFNIRRLEYDTVADINHKSMKLKKRIAFKADNHKKSMTIKYKTA